MTQRGIHRYQEDLPYPWEWPEVKKMVALANSLGGSDEDAIHECLLRMCKFEAALRSIAGNTCCDRCQEAALVAKQALDPAIA